MTAQPNARRIPAATAPESDLPDEAYLAALAGLPMMGPHRLLNLFRAYGARGAWRQVCTATMPAVPELDGRLGRDPASLLARWASAAERVEPDKVWASHLDAGIVGAALGSPRYPSPLAEDPEPPAIVFMSGNPDVLEGPRVAIVGTRNCTRIGREFATELGRGLAAAGVRVVSGLALGVDGAAHLGALAATGGDEGAGPPVAVVAGGLDLRYPRRHADLHRHVESAGLVISEAPLGTPSEAWRFPARNRIIAGLSDAVVVVESRIKGGSMHTADEALARGITVLAVPGSVRSPASAGTNALLAAGATVACDVDDVLTAIGLAQGRRPVSRHRALRPAVPADPVGRAVLEALGWEPLTFEALVARSGLALAPLAAQVAALEAGGFLVRTDGWLERTGGRHG